MQQAVGQGGVGAGGQAQVQVGGGSSSAAGVGDYQLPAVAALGLKVLHYGGHSLGYVAADQEYDLGLGYILQREGQAPVNPEGPDASSGSRGHTEAPVVVNVGGTQGHASELAQQVSLFVGQGTAAKNAHRIGAVVGPGLLEGGGHPAQRVLPGCRGQVAGGAADQGSQQAVGVSQGSGGSPALDAQGALVHRKIGIARHNRRISRPRQPHPALESAVGAVGSRFGPVRCLRCCGGGQHWPVTLPISSLL